MLYICTACLFSPQTITQSRWLVLLVLDLNLESSYYSRHNNLSTFIQFILPTLLITLSNVMTPHSIIGARHHTLLVHTGNQSHVITLHDTRSFGFLHKPTVYGVVNLMYGVATSDSMMEVC